MPSYDYVVIGAGYGGLSAASLLVKAGFKVLLLESHIAVGGCASFFRRKDFLFDVGATTFSGVLERQPLGKLLNDLNIKPQLKHLDLGMQIHLTDGNIFNRYADQSRLITEAKRIFGNQGQESFWNEIKQIDQLSWQLIDENPSLMPSSISGWLSQIKPSNLKALKLIPGLFLPMKQLLAKHGLAKNKSFIKLIDELLLITAQNTHTQTPYMSGALGLAYPAETYYPYGGMYKPAIEILDRFKDYGGEFKIKQKVNKIETNQDGYTLHTQNAEYKTRGIISNIPIWNMQEICNGEIKEYFQKYTKRFQNAWGAYVINFAIKSDEYPETAYHQIHSKETIPNCAAEAFFVTLSLPDDQERAPKGWRTVTISTHTDAQQWFDFTKEEYEEKKLTTEQYILERFFEALPKFKNSQIEFCSSASSRTFEFYTGRKSGFVGGIAHSLGGIFLKFIPNKLPFENFYLTGDTTFPGQGVPSVVYSAMSAVNKILEKN